MDAITWSNRGKDGEKMTVGAIDESRCMDYTTNLRQR